MKVPPSMVMRDFSAFYPVVRNAIALCLVALLAACSTSRPPVSAVVEAQQYRAHARSNYTPPGPPGDPWGPYIMEAAGKYDLPDRWIREVMRAESSGKPLETSAPGAMGLMQVMPSTYDILRAKYGLGDDAYDPHDNIMAGAAYMREMYDIYGAPGFLAAYNAGPGRFDDYLSRNRPLPDETRNYVAKIAPRIAGTQPSRISEAQYLAMNQIPTNIPPGPRYPRQRQQPVLLADQRRTGAPRSPVQATNLPPPEPPRQVAQAQLPQPASLNKGGFHLIAPAVADTLPRASGGANTWAIQVGAFGNANLARAAAESANAKAGGLGQPMVGATKQANNTLYRARVVGMTREGATQACEKLVHAKTNCIILSPTAQS
jgi:cell division protein FtsN